MEKVNVTFLTNISLIKNIGVNLLMLSYIKTLSIISKNTQGMIGV